MLSRLSLRARLIGAFAVMMMVLVGMGAIASTSTRTINGHLVLVQSNALPSVAKAGEVTANVSGVANAAQETGAAANQVLASASELSHQSGHLSAEVTRFLATVRAA